MIQAKGMTKDEALRQLTQLVGRKVVGLGQDRPKFIAWALEAEHLFGSALDPKSPALVAYQALAPRANNR